MSPDADEGPPGRPVAAEVEDARIEQEMEQSYIDYAMSVIAGRALPDARDGLKPVHRRILYAMQEAGVTANASHRKSSSIVGETMGDYHPHGDSAIYDALARMAQEFSMRHPLVDGQGNFGSVDGDPPAAMRYTEARMSSIAEELLADIERDTVDFADNYDGRLQEPEVLPAGYPNLLVNGSSGIAVGMSTNIPPHNLGEIVDAAVALIDDPDLDAMDLVDTDHLLDGEAGSTGPVKGPDFPTGATVVGAEGVLDAYNTGRGRVRVRADYEVTEDRIVVTELPYQTNKSRLVERIADDVNEGKIDGVRDLRDESDRDGIRVVIELKRGAQPDVVENQLLDSHLESTFGVITLALVDGEPRVLNIKEALEVYLDHRREVVRRRSEHELAEREERAHVLEGRLKALERAEDVVETIRNAEDRDAAKVALEETYGFSERQAEHVVAMQLGSLTSLEAEAIETEYENVRARVEELETILADEAELMAVVREELLDVKAEYADPRRTSFAQRTGQVTREDLIEQRDDVVVVSEDDYVKRMPLSEFRAQRRGGKGIIGADLKQDDRVSSAFVANTHDYLLCFTNHGQVYQLKTYQVPEMSRTARGKSAVNVLDLDDGEEIAAVVNTTDMDAGYLTMATAGGRIKRTSVDQFGNILSTGIRAISLEDGDELVDVAVTDGEADLVLATGDGMSIRFAEDEVRSMGRSARGVRGIQLEGDDRVVGVAAADSAVHDWLLTVTKNGYGKRTDIDSYRRQSRNGKGLIDIKTNERNGPVCSIETVSYGDHLLVMSESGQIMRTPVEEISTVGRNTMGVTVMDVAADDRVASVDVIDAGRVEDEPVEGENEPAAEA
ncbi:MAG: DNA gyrase subunit A [Haloferacaceae archaeon]